MNHFLKSLLDLLQYCFFSILFIYLFIFGYEECGILAPDWGLNQYALYWKAILTTGLSVNSLGQGLKRTLSEEAREASS